MGELLRLVDLIKKSKSSYNTIEIQMLLTEVYNKLTTTGYNATQVSIFGDILYREEHKYSGFDMTHDLLRVYNDSSVLKYTGINFIEWLDLPISKRELITERCKFLTKEESALMESYNKKNNIDIKGLKE